MDGSTDPSARVGRWIRSPDTGDWPALVVAGVLAGWVAFVAWTATTLSTFTGSDPGAFVARSLALADAIRAGRGLAYVFSSIDPPLRYVPFAVAYLFTDPDPWGARRIAVAIVGLAVLVATPLLWFLVGRRLVDDRTGAAFVVCWSALAVVGGVEVQFPFGAWQYAVASPVGVGALVVASHVDAVDPPRVGAGVGLLCGVAAMVQSGVALTVAVVVGAGWVLARRWRPLAWATGVGTATVAPMFAFAAAYTSRAGGMGPDVLLSVGGVPATLGDLLWRLTLSPMVPVALLAVLAVGAGYSFGARIDSPLLRGGVAAFAPVAVFGTVGPLEWYYFLFVASHVGVPVAVMAALDQVRALPGLVERFPVDWE